MFVTIIGWLILGLIVGFVASKVANLRGDDPGIGIGLSGVAAVVGGWIYSAISGSPVGGINFWSLLFALLASALAMLIWHSLRARAASRA